MRQTVTELEAEGNEGNRLREQRAQWMKRITPDHAERLAKAIEGSKYTNPEITATLGLSDTPIDMAAIHKNSYDQALRAHALSEHDTGSIQGGNPNPAETPFDRTLIDILRMDQQEFVNSHDHQPEWWDDVDPGGFWRNVQVPEIKDVYDILKLNEAQAVKLFASKTYEEWNQIPGIIPGSLPGTETYKTDAKGNIIPAPENFDAYRNLTSQFPTVKGLWDHYRNIERLAPDNPHYMSGLEVLGQNLTSDARLVGGAVLGAIQAPFNLASYIIPDKIKSETMGINIPIKDTLEPAAAGVRGTTKAATAVMMGAAQAVKSTIEFNMTHPGALSSLGVWSVPVDAKSLEDYKKMVYEGNILTQIIKRGFDPNKSLDLGGGFFPEGQAKTDALKFHDEGLPKIDGKTWTLGRQFVDPFIQQGYIDRDGYAASVMSGIVDGTFTLATDPSLYSNPISPIMEYFGINRVAATNLATKYADEILKARRAAAGFPEVKIEGDIIEGFLTGEQKAQFGEFALPAGSKLPPESEAILTQLVDDAIQKQGLETLDSASKIRIPQATSQAQAIKDTFGVTDLPNGNKTFDPMVIDEMPYRTDGKLALNKLSSFENVGQLYDAFLGDIPPGLAYKIQTVVDAAKAKGKEVDIKEVHAALREGVLSGDPMFNIRETPGVIKPIIQQTGKQIAYWTSNYTRQFATMPYSTFFSFTDPLGSVKDMNKLMILFKVPKDVRHTVLSSAIKALATGDVGKRFELKKQWYGAVIEAEIGKLGAPKEWIEALQSFKADNALVLWSMDADGQPYTTPYMAEDAGDVVRSNDLMAKGFPMINPKQFKQAMRETTNLWNIFKPFRGNPTVEKLLQPTIFNALEQIQNRYLKPIALGAPLPIRMATKVIPDELLRMAATGEISILSIFAGLAANNVNYTTAGKIIASAKEIEKASKTLDGFETQYARLKAATDLGETEYAASIQELIDSMIADFGTPAELKRLVATFEDRIDTELPGLGRKMAEMSEGLMAADRTNESVIRWERTNITQHAFKDVDSFGRVVDPESKKNLAWVKGTARDIVSMSEAPEYREVAKALLAGGKQAVSELPERFLNGDLKPVFEKIYKKMLLTQGSGAMSTTQPIDSLAGNTMWVATIATDILTRTGMDAVAIGAIATQKLGETRILKQGSRRLGNSIAAFNIYDETPEFNKWVKENLLPNPSTPKVAPFHMSRSGDTIEEKSAIFAKTFAMYRNTSNKLARTPWQQWQKWKRVIELIPAMDPKEALKMAEALDKTDAAPWIKQSIRTELPRAQGQATRKQVELLGEMYGHQQVDSLLYNFNNKSYFGSRHSLLFAFIDAFREQWTVWGRLMATNPSNLERARQAKEGAVGTEVPSWAGGAEGRGFLFTDPETGNQAVGVPFSKPLYNWLGLNAEERINTKNLSLLGTGVPGSFGIGAIVLDTAIPKTEAFSGLRSVLFPISDPAARSRISDYYLPSWAQWLGTSATSLAGESRTSDFITNLQAFTATETTESLRATTLNAVLTNIASNSSSRPKTSEARDKQIEDATTKADLLLGIKALFKIVSPGASMTKYFTDLGTENVASGAVMDDLRTMTEKDWNKGVEQFLNKYGSDAWIYLSGSTTSTPGMQPTKEFSEWYGTNSKIVDKYPLIGAFLGPQNGEYSPEAYTEQKALDYRNPIKLKDRQDKSLSNLAWSVYNNLKTSLDMKGVEQGLTLKQTRNSEQYKAIIKQQKIELRKKYPMWDPEVTSGLKQQEINNQIMQIEKMVKDPKVINSPVGAVLKAWWDYRNQKIAEVVAADPSYAGDGWTQSNRTSPMRQLLINYGEKLVDNYPEFSNLWEYVLSKQFAPPAAG